MIWLTMKPALLQAHVTMMPRLQAEEGLRRLQENAALAGAGMPSNLTARLMAQAWPTSSCEGGVSAGAIARLQTEFGFELKLVPDTEMPPSEDSQEIAPALALGLEEQ